MREDSALTKLTPHGHGLSALGEDEEMLQGLRGGLHVPGPHGPECLPGGLPRAFPLLPSYLQQLTGCSFLNLITNVPQVPRPSPPWSQRCKCLDCGKHQHFRCLKGQCTAGALGPALTSSTQVSFPSLQHTEAPGAGHPPPSWPSARRCQR